MDLFDLANEKSKPIPLAERMRAKTLKEFLGQDLQEPSTISRYRQSSLKISKTAKGIYTR